MTRTLTISTLLLAAALPAQTITFAEGTPTALDIVSVAESNPNGGSTTVLQGIQLLPIEITGRYLGQEHDTSRSRRLDRSGIVRVELPDGGRLFRYRRNGGAFWGFLHVAADGSARSVLERSGGAQSSDPFVDRIGVAPQGGHFAVPLRAGGLCIVRLDGLVYASTNLPSRIVAAGSQLEEKSVLVGPQVVWFQSENLEVFHCGLGDGDQPVDVSPPAGPNDDLEDTMAMSDDGSRIVYLFGPSNQQARIYTATATSTAATVLPPPATKYEDPNYLPEDPGSRALLLNADGTRLFYIDSDVRDEMFLLDVTGQLPTLHVTDDPIFQPYIGVHILPGFFADELTVAIGDPNRMDWFRARLGAQGGTVQNLTATGSPSQPFPEGTIDPVSGAIAGSVGFVTEQTATGLRVRRLDLAGTGQTVVAGNAVGVPYRAGSFGQQADLIVPTAQGDVLYAGQNLGAPLFALPTDFHLPAPANGPNFSAVEVELAGSNWSVPAFYLSNGQFVLGSLEQGIVQVAATAADGVVVVGPTVRYFGLGTSAVINRPAVSWRRCLSGAGA